MKQIAFLAVCLAPGIFAQDTVGGCDQPDCLTCTPEGGCLGCSRAIVQGTRQCVATCPGNFRLVHSDVDGYQGLLCRAPKFLDAADMTGEELAVLVAALVGAAICIGVLVGAYLFLRVRRKMDPMAEREMETGDTEMTMVSDLGRIQFLTRLQALRPETQNFLEMLNDTRKKFHNTSGSGDSKNDSKNKAYRAIVRDLSRILSLLNRKEEQIRTVPADWERLLGWAERLLKRYKRQKISREFGSAPHIEYLGTSTAHAPRRPRSAAGRIHTNGSLYAGSHFSISQAIIEEDDEFELPPVGDPQNHSRTAPPPAGRRGGRATGGRGGARSLNASVPTGLHLMSEPGDARSRPVFVHQLNGGQGELICDGLWSSRPGSRASGSVQNLAARGPGSVQNQRSVAGNLHRDGAGSVQSGAGRGAERWPAPPRSLPPGGAAVAHPVRGPRPQRHPLVQPPLPQDNRQENPPPPSQPRQAVWVKRDAGSPADREKTSDFTDTASGNSANGSTEGVPPPPPPPVFSPAVQKQLNNSYNEQSDYIERDLDSYSGRHCHDEVSTIL